MGLLDDAIREHLELKRQHGGDPNEIERLEREAFGPGGSRRPAQAEDTAEDAEVSEAGRADDEVVEPGPEQAAVEPAEAPQTAEQPAADEIPPPVEDEAPRPGHEAGAPGYDEDPWLEAQPAPAEPGPQEDVLEETPDFLQETPEHDRLWFEQKPPRDFDWDK